jgi:hypothetical protein
VAIFLKAIIKMVILMVKVANSGKMETAIMDNGRRARDATGTESGLTPTVTLKSGSTLVA